MKTQLILTFTTKTQYNSLINTVLDGYNLMYDKIFVFNTDVKDETVCSYSIEFTPNTLLLPNSVTVHKKNETNTYYSINALNIVIEKETGSRNNYNHKIQWKDYQNTILLTENSELKIIPTELYLIERIR